MEKAISTESIIESLRDIIQSGQTLSPERFVNAGMMLTALLGSENDKYADMYQSAHKIQSEAISRGDTGSSAEAEMKASDEYRDMQKQKGKCEQVMEMIRLAKIRSQLADKEMPLS